MGEAYIRRKYGLAMLPPVSISDSIVDFFNLDNASKIFAAEYSARETVQDFINMDNETINSVLRYTFASIADAINMDNETKSSILAYTFASIVDNISLDNEAKINALRFAFAAITDAVNLDNETITSVLRYTFAFIADSINMDNEAKVSALRFAFATIADAVNLDNETITSVLRYTFASITDSVNLDNEAKISALRFAFATIADAVNMDNEAKVSALRFAFASITDAVNLDNEAKISALRFAADSITDSINMDNETKASALRFVSGSITDIINLDNEAIITAQENPLQPPLVGNIFNIGPETASVVVQNQDDFPIRVYFSLTNASGQPNTSNDYVSLQPSGFTGDAESIQIHTYFNLLGNNDYTFYARAYALNLVDASQAVSREFSTPKYSFVHNPEWIASNLSVGQTSIQFSYKNNNAVDATLVVTVLDNGSQAMDLLSEPIQAGQTLIFNSNDYNDSFEANTTYTFNAKFTKTDYNDSGSTTNNVTTSKETTAEPEILVVNPSGTSVSFDIRNKDDDQVTVYYELNDNTPNAYSDTLSPAGITGDRESYTITGLNYSTPYTLWATAEAAGKNRSSADSVSFQTDAPPPPPQTAKPGITVTGTTETSVTFVITNNDNDPVEANYSINTSPATTGNIPSITTSSSPITRTGLSAGTPYTITVTAQASGKTLSEPATEPFSTDTPPPTTYTLKARSSGVSPVNVTIGGTGYTLTTSYQNVDTATSSKTTTLVAPTQVIAGSDTYTFTQWRNVTTNTTISTVNSTSITWSSDTNIEAIYVLVPQLGGL